ncbi:MAG: Gx transporter family protein [Lachnospiraceae bacterium]|nr:Gx transporter family protein [Candidatus Equihabitans merdae]
MTSGKIATCALLTTVAMVLSYVEAMMPIPFPVPGMKLGLANLAIILVLYLYSWREALLVSVVRILLSGFLFGNVMSIAFSLAGGFLSLLLMALIKKTKWLPMMGISMIGGVTHNLGQLIVAMIVLQTTKIGYYFAALMVTGAITGLLIGLLGSAIYERLKKVAVK